MDRYNYGMIGLGTMGRNLLYNIAEHGFSIIGYYRKDETLKELEDGITPEMNVKATDSYEDLVSHLELPRKVILMVPAGNAVDDVIQRIIPFLSDGDIIIDGGNTYFKDTNRRISDLKAKKLHLVGMGVSGGEQGARIGPSIMPGGDIAVFNQLKPMLEAIAAKVNDEPCTAYMGETSAGNYVKMVHNGIEYAIMQLISEAYDLLKRVAKLDNDQLYEVFRKWNDGEMNSFLIEITRDIFQQKDPLTNAYLVDQILDKAGAKGTGKWTSQEGLEIGISIPTIDSSVTSRILSAYKDERVHASQLYSEKEITTPEDIEQFIQDVGDALFVSTLISYAQGLALLVKASDEYHFQIPLKDVVKIWRGGCIIRSLLLEKFYAAYSADPQLSNILLNREIAVMVKSKISGLRKVASFATNNSIPSLGLQSALGYFDAYTTASLPINLIQAQRDYFGAHTYERVDREGIFHTSWGTTIESD